ncbi:MAG: S1C family serine protease [Bacteroidia bacterium]
MQTNSPSPKKTGLFLLLIFCCLPAFLPAQQRSVVLIHTEGGSGYGVAWDKPNQIVTALHLVSGMKNIQVNWEGKKSSAQVVKILQASDLALLSLSTNLNIPPLKAFTADPPLDIDLNYWEVKTGAAQMTSKTTQLQKRTTLGKIDPRLVQNPQAGQDFARSLCSDGNSNYPTLNTGIIKFGEKNISKAHSGSPITFQDKIVGIVDGGNKPVNGSVSVWAIPATEFQRLLTNGTSYPPSHPSCSSDKLYSGLRTDNPFLSPELRETAREIEFSQNNPVTASGDSDFSLSLTYRTTCGDYYETLFEEDQQYIADIVQISEKVFPAEDRLQVYDLYPQPIDIYQDAVSGATIAIPQNTTIKTTSASDHTLIEVSSPGDGITMYIYISHQNSLSSCMEEVNWFKEYLESDGLPWQEDVDFPDEEPEDYTDDPDDPYYYEEFSRVILDEDDYITAQFDAYMIISDTDFIGVSVQVNDWQAVDDDKNERLMYYLMDACATITDFPYY